MFTPLQRVPGTAAIGQCCALGEFHSEQDEVHVGLGLFWPQEASFTSVNYLQWCIGATAGKPFCFWLQPLICFVFFPRRILHRKKIEKKIHGLYPAGHSNTWRMGARARSLNTPARGETTPGQVNRQQSTDVVCLWCVQEHEAPDKQTSEDITSKSSSSRLHQTVIKITLKQEQ